MADIADTAVTTPGDAPLPVIAILGGTGDLGAGLARRWHEAGYPVCIGSRDPAKAAATVAALRRGAGADERRAGSLRALGNRAAAEAAEIVVLTVPFAHQAATLEAVSPALRGKILVDATVPLQAPPRLSEARMPEEGSAAARAQAIVGERVRVVSAFQNVAADHIRASAPLDADVLVCGDDKAAREAVIALVRAAGMRGLHAGKLANAVAAEALTSALLHINRHYRCRAGIRVTGLAT